MKRADLEHLIAAVSALVRDPDLYVLGSQAILGAFPDAPPELLGSLEADVYPKVSPLGAVLIDDALGERSAFHRTYGYYAHAVTPEISTLPDNWRTRLIPVRSRAAGRATGWCLEPHDLVVSKLAAGRKKDLAFVRRLLQHNMIQAAVVRERLAVTPVSEAGGRGLLARLQQCVLSARSDRPTHRSRLKRAPKRNPR